MNDVDCSIWLFQANPNRYDLPAELKDMAPGEQTEWNLNQYRDTVGFGDIVLLWSASGGGRRQRGIYGVARVNGDSFRRRSKTSVSEFAVPLRIEATLDEPVTYDALSDVENLADLSILNYHQGTNFPVTQPQWKTLVDRFPQLSIDIASPPERSALPPSRKRELADLLDECLQSYDWKSHLDDYGPVRERGKENYVTILEARAQGEDVTDLVLERLLPHVDTKFNRETRRWIHKAPSISRDIKDWYEGSGWTDASEWPEVSAEILTFVERCLDEHGDLSKACKAFSDSSVATGFQTGTLTPILNALRPEQFSLINNKSREALNYFAVTNHSQKLNAYPEVNQALSELIEEAGDLLSDGPLSDYLPGDVFDMLSHWLRAKKKFEFKPQTEKFWKVSPGAGAKFWDQCRDGGFIAVGWDMLGDISEWSHTEFQARRDELVAGDDDLTKSALNQVWRFSRMREGDVVVANKGISSVVGIGVIIGDYYFDDTADSYKHRVPVEWNDTDVHKVDQPGWRSTFIKLDRATYSEIENAPIVEGNEAIAAIDTGDLDEPETKSIAGQRSIFLEETENIILFGPPGTGKTWSTNHRAVQLCLRPDTSMSNTELEQEYRRLHRMGQIEFLTFHQSFAYEEFVEGIRPVMVEDDGGDNDEVAYRCEDGSFKQIALRAAAEGVQLSSKQHTFETLWQQLLDDVREAEEQDEDCYTIKNYKGHLYGLTATAQDNLRAHRIGDDGDRTKLTGSSLGAGKSYSRALWERRKTLGDDPAKYSYQSVSSVISDELGTGGGCHGHILWAVHFDLLNRADHHEPESSAHDLSDKQRITLLKDFLDRGPRSEVSLSYEDVPEYVLIIDEINRGNISKILGELITLLEPSKRLTGSDELIVTLPYSKERFGVPPNLHIIGTMNTADRSIALMDVALRRRFTFEPMLPDWRILRDTLQISLTDHKQGDKEEFINLVVAIFENINARIEFLYDADHQLGHTFFMKVKGYKTLRKAFLQEIIPLLQEYFYETWERLCLALGCPYDEYGAPARDDGHAVAVERYRAPLVTATPLIEHDLLGMRHDEFRNQQRFVINPNFKDEDLKAEEMKSFFEGILSGKYLSRFQERFYTSKDRS